MKEDIDVASIVASGNLSPMLDWLREHDFAYDYLNPKDWIKKVTGSDMDPTHFTTYLEKKFF